MKKSVSLSLLATTLVLLFAGVVVVPAAAENKLAVQADGKIVIAGVAMRDAGALVRYLPDGSLDPSFGAGGIAIDRRLGGYTAMSLDAAGRILAASPRGGKSPLEPSVGRYLADGASDVSFGSGGLTVEPAAGSLGGWPTTVLAGADGRILVATNVHGGKFTPPPGAVVAAFSSSGQFLRSVLDMTNAVVAGPTRLNDLLAGSGVAVGSRYSGGSEPPRQLILRLKEGAPAGYDPAFGDGEGLALGPAGEAQALVEDQAGRFLVAGGSNIDPNTSATHGVLSRFAADGTLDTGFASPGRADLAIPGARALSLRAVALAQDGSIVAAGFAELADPGAHCGSCAVAVVARFTPAGQLDAGFGNGGVVVLGVGSFGDGRLPAFNGEDVAVLGDGSVLITGTGTTEAHPFVLARLTPAGQLDSGFGNGGVVTTYTCSPGPREAVQRRCFIRPRVALRVGNLRTRKPSLRLTVRPDQRWAQIESVRLVLPRSLRLRPGRIAQGGVLRATAGTRQLKRPVLIDKRIVAFDDLRSVPGLTLTLSKGAFRAAKRLGLHQRLGFKVIVGFTNEGEGPQTVVLHRRP